MDKGIHSSLDRRSGIERRCFSYVAHIPERRSGTDRRVSGERRKDRTIILSGLSLEDRFGVLIGMCQGDDA